MVNMSDVWHSLPNQTFPITGICIVADKAKCPPGYTLVDKTDGGEDADIWKDSFFSRRVTRYFCITRIFPQDYGRINNVLTAIMIVNSVEELPEGFTQIEWTHDSREKATRKRVCGVKMAPRDSVTDAISEIALTSAIKRTPPVGFTMLGDMDGPNLCYKVAPIPSQTNNRGANSSSEASDSSVLSPTNDAYNVNVTVTPQEPLPHRTSFQHQATEACFLDGVTFTLNSKFAPSNATSKFEFPQPKFKSAEDIENEFSYTFTSEYQLMES